MSPETSKWRHIVTQHMIELSRDNKDLLFSCENCIQTHAGLLLTIESCDVWDESDYSNVEPSKLLDHEVKTQEFISWKQVGQLYCNRNARIAAHKAKQKRKG